MRNPKELLTEAGYRKFLVHIENLKEAHRYFSDDDFHLECDEELDWWYAELPKLIEKLEKGPYCDC